MLLGTSAASILGNIASSFNKFWNTKVLPKLT